MDKKDEKILNLLTKNVRPRYSHIAKEMKMTENAVKYRIKKMENAGIIKSYFPELSSKKLGKMLTVIFLLNIEPQKLAESLKILKSYKELTWIDRCSGEFSLHCKGYFNTNEDMLEFMDKKLLKEVPVTAWKEFVVLKPIKEKFFGIE